MVTDVPASIPSPFGSATTPACAQAGRISTSTPRAFRTPLPSSKSTRRTSASGIRLSWFRSSASAFRISSLAAERLSVTGYGYWPGAYVFRSYSLGCHPIFVAPSQSARLLALISLSDSTRVPTAAFTHS